MRLAHLSARLTFSLLILLATQSQATVIIDNGLAPPNPDNVINTPILEAVFVQDSTSGEPTTVEMVDGGQVGQGTWERFEAFGSSIILMSGGYVNDDIFMHDSTTLYMTGGRVNSGTHGYDSSQLFVSGGILESGLTVFSPGATALITGGAVGSVNTQGLGAVATVRGGTDLFTFHAQGESTINVVGGSFSVNGESVGLGEIPAIYGASGTLTGVLQSGESLSVSFTRDIDTGDPLNPIIQGKIVLVPEPGACTDSLDNDGDGYIDYPDDLGCTGYTDPSEEPDCMDSLDNDGDGLTDYPDDPGCVDASDSSEKDGSLLCDDALDNDGDGFTDYPDDPGCFNPAYFAENPQCQDGINNDPNQDGWIDFDGGVSAGVPPEWQTAPDPQCVGTPHKNNERCGLGAELALLLPPLMWLYRRSSRRG